MQNDMEGDQFLGDKIPRVLEKGKDYVIVQRADRNDAVTGAFLKPLQSFTPIDVQMHTETWQNAMTKLGLDDFTNYDLLWNDFKSKRNWGILDGKPVLVDIGAVNSAINFASKPDEYAVRDWANILSERRAISQKSMGEVNKNWITLPDGRRVDIQGKGEEKLLGTITNSSGKEVHIIQNPAPSVAEKISHGDALRGFITKDGNIVAWDSYYALHSEVAGQMPQLQDGVAVVVYPEGTVDLSDFNEYEGVHSLDKAAQMITNSPAMQSRLKQYIDAGQSLKLEQYNSNVVGNKAQEIFSQGAKKSINGVEKYYYRDASGRLRYVPGGVGTTKEAENFASGSAIKETLFHGVDDAGAAKIRETGFKPDPEGEYGKAVYFASDPTIAADYGPNIFPAKINVQNVKYIDSFQTLVDESNAMGIDINNYRDYISRNYDALVIRNEKYVAVYKPQTIAVFDAKDTMAIVDPTKSIESKDLEVKKVIIMGENALSADIIEKYYYHDGHGQLRYVPETGGGNKGAMHGLPQGKEELSQVYQHLKDQAIMQIDGGRKGMIDASGRQVIPSDPSIPVNIGETIRGINISNAKDPIEASQIILDKLPDNLGQNQLVREALVNWGKTFHMLLYDKAHPKEKV